MTATASLEVIPPQELAFVLSQTEATPRVTLTLKHPGVTKEALAFKVGNKLLNLVDLVLSRLSVRHLIFCLTAFFPSSYVPCLLQVKTTQPRRYLVRPNQGLIRPGGTESVQILLVEKDKNSLLQSYSRLGQAALDHSKDKFLVQSCVVAPDFVADYGSSAEEAYDKLSGLWASVTSSAANTIANKKLHVRHTVSEPDGLGRGGGASSAAAAAEMPAKHVVAANVQDMTSEQLLTEVNNLRRKYDELVAFSVNLTAERDILNNTLEQTKRDLNRELAKSKMPSSAQRASGAAAKSASGSGTRSALLLAVVALIFFVLGSRTDYAVVKSLPVLGSWLPGGPKAAGGASATDDSAKGKPARATVDEL
jgi:MSP (Major sperm protein) domain